MYDLPKSGKVAAPRQSIRHFDDGLSLAVRMFTYQLIGVTSCWGCNRRVTAPESVWDAGLSGRYCEACVEHAR